LLEELLDELKLLLELEELLFSLLLRFALGISLLLLDDLLLEQSLDCTFSLA
jgi:hypothetical protein